MLYYACYDAAVRQRLSIDLEPACLPRRVSLILSRYDALDVEELVLRGATWQRRALADTSRSKAFTLAVPQALAPRRFDSSMIPRESAWQRENAV